MALTDETKKLTGSIMAVAAVIGLCFGVYFHFQKTFAPMAIAEELKQFKDEYRYDKLNSIRNQKQQRIYIIKEREGEKPANKTAREELLGLQTEIEQLDDQIKKMEKR